MAKTISDRNARLLELYRQGQPLEAIGQEFGISRQRVYQIIRVNDPKPFEKRGNSSRFKPPQEGTLGWRLWQAAVRVRKSADQIANELGVSDATVRRWWHAENEGARGNVPSMVDGAKYMNAVGASMEELLGIAPPPAPLSHVSPKEQILLQAYRALSPERQQDLICLLWRGSSDCRPDAE